MTDNSRTLSVDRRTVLRGVGTVAAVGAVAGCTTDTSDDGDGGDGGGTPTDGGGGFDKSTVDSWLSETSNYDGIVDKTGTSNPTVMVGADGNGGDFAFKPAAIKVSTGTKVTWEWTGDGGQHNVVHKGGNFESKINSQSGFTFEYTFDSTGVFNYLCQPHESLGMKGSIIVV